MARPAVARLAIICASDWLPAIMAFNCTSRSEMPALITNTSLMPILSRARKLSIWPATVSVSLRPTASGVATTRECARA